MVGNSNVDILHMSKNIHNIDIRQIPDNQLLAAHCSLGNNQEMTTVAPETIPMTMLTVADLTLPAVVRAWPARELGVAVVHL